MLVNCLLAVLPLPQVQRHAMCFASCLFNLLDRLLRVCLFFRQVYEADVRTLTRHQDGYRTSNAGIAASDQTCLVLEQTTAFVFLKVWLAIVGPELELGPVRGRLQFGIKTRPALLVLGLNGRGWIRCWRGFWLTWHLV